MPGVFSLASVCFSDVQPAEGTWPVNLAKAKVLNLLGAPSRDSGFKTSYTAPNHTTTGLNVQMSQVCVLIE